MDVDISGFDPESENELRRLSPSAVIAAEDEDRFSAYQAHFEKNGINCVLVTSAGAIMKAAAQSDGAVVFLSYNLYGSKTSEQVQTLNELIGADCIVFSDTDDTKRVAEISSRRFERTILPPFKERNFLMSFQTIVNERKKIFDAKLRKLKHHQRLRDATKTTDQPKAESFKPPVAPAKAGPKAESDGILQSGMATEPSGDTIVQKSGADLSVSDRLVDKRDKSATHSAHIKGPKAETHSAHVKGPKVESHSAHVKGPKAETHSAHVKGPKAESHSAHVKGPKAETHSAHVKGPKAESHSAHVKGPKAETHSAHVKGPKAETHSAHVKGPKVESHSAHVKGPKTDSQTAPPQQPPPPEKKKPLAPLFSKEPIKTGHELEDQVHPPQKSESLSAQKVIVQYFTEPLTPRARFWMIVGIVIAGLISLLFLALVLKTV